MSQEKNKTNTLVGMLEPYFAKAPALPKNAQEGLVKFMPIIALVFGLLGVVTAIGAVGALTALSPLAALGGVQSVGSYGTGIVAAVFWLGSSALMLMAYPSLQAKKVKGWNLLFWSEVLSLVGSVVSLSIVSGIIGALIGFYLLFQVKSFYK